MAKYKVGQKYGRITILEIFPYEKSMGSQRNGLVVCDCSPDKPYQMNIYNLGTGHTKSCGCFSQERAVETNTTHGYSKKDIYSIFHKMIARCYKEEVKNYHNYGGRGIKVCDRWLEPNGQGFLNFLEDMGERPSKNHSIDRINVNGNYEPSNCRWATPKEQANNKQYHRFITANGKTQNLSQWSKEIGIESSVILGRLKLGWTEETAINIPLIDCNKYYEYQGEIISHQDLANKHNINEATLRNRLSKGMSMEDALSLPDLHKKWLTYKNETKSVVEWSKSLGIPCKLIYGRLDEGWSVEDALSKPKHKPTTYTHDKKTLTLSEWSKLTGISYKLLWKRIKNGMTIGEAIY